MAIRDKEVEAGRSAAAVGSGAIVDLGDQRHLGESALPPGAEPEARSQWQLFWRRFFRHKVAVIAGIILIALYLLALFAPQIAPYELNPRLDAATLLQGRKGPSGAHWFGTDELGRDQLTRILYAGRISLMVGLVVALVSTFLGTTIGAAAGYFGGWVDQLLMRVTDLFLVVPGLAILMMAQKGLAGKAIFGHKFSSQGLIILILSFLYWQYIARVVRGVFLSLKEREFVEAARASGASSFRIITRHMLPNTIGPIAVNTTLVVGLAILTESTLSFLGFGVQPPTVSWGNMLAQSEGAVGTPQAYLVYFPGLAILLTVLAVNFLGDGMRDAFDPQSNH
jgi:peptide/nickel transport system permease protein